MASLLQSVRSSSPRPDTASTLTPDAPVASPTPAPDMPGPSTPAPAAAPAVAAAATSSPSSPSSPPVAEAQKTIQPVPQSPTPSSVSSCSSSSSSSTSSTLSLPAGQNAEITNAQARSVVIAGGAHPKALELDPALPTHNGTNDTDTTAVSRHPRSSRTIAIREAGESGRRGVHPIKFIKVLFASPSRVAKLCNVLWPLVPVAIVLQYVHHDQQLLAFIFSYLAIIPCANLIGFSGGQLTHKLPHVWGLALNTLCESITEIILVMVLLKREKYVVIQAALLGSILATMLLCLGLCFFIGGVYHRQQIFDSFVSEASSGLLLAGGVTLAIPSLFYHSLSGSGHADIADKTRDISRAIAIILMVAYFVYLFFMYKSNRSILHDIFEDAARTLELDDATTKPGHRNKSKLTMTECWVALIISVGLVTVLSIGLVNQIGYVVEHHHISDPFLGLILVPVCEKAAEHLHAIEEAYENRSTFALSHVLNATLQTTFFTGPLVVMVGWGLGLAMDFNFDIFNIAMLILGILAVGNFTRDQKSNYLEGFLCLAIYSAIAVAAWYYPNPEGGH